MRKSYLPAINHPFKVSKPALTLILATVLLAVILAVTTKGNINREQQLMENSLLQQGLTLIRSFEAGARTTMMHRMMGSNPMETLVTETAAEESVAYIRIMDEHGHLVIEAGDVPETLDSISVNLILSREEGFTFLDRKSGVFEIGRRFEPLPPLLPGRRKNPFRHRPLMKDRQHHGKLVIFIGLYTHEFDVAHRDDIRQTLLMGAILFLIGSGGLYFLFLYQGMRVTRATLATMRRYTQNVIESMPAGLITLDVNTKIVSCNTKAEELIGRPTAELEGVALPEALPCYPLEQLEEQKEMLDQFVECSRGNDEPVPVKVSSSQLLDNNGVRIGTVLILRDMREIRKMEQQLERSRRMAALGSMAAGIAHEIRNPLGTLRGFAQYFGAQAEKQSEARQYADLMVSEVDRLNQTISALLQFAKPREPKFVQVDIDTLFRKTEQLMQAEFNSRSISFHLRHNEDQAIHLQADPDLLLQVLLNLLKNSINATPVGGNVTLGAWEDEKEVYIQVSDNGYGMGWNEKERMFDPFFTTRKEGTGLGLAVSHQIVEQHGGDFEVQTEPNEGTVITICLPQSR